MSDPNNQSKDTKPKKKSTATIIGIVVISVVLLLIIITAIYFYRKRASNDCNCPGATNTNACDIGSWLKHPSLRGKKICSIPVL